ncbi:MAG: DUF4442 domain-containing protein [Oligoflexia bacterium]
MGINWGVGHLLLKRRVKVTLLRLLSFWPPYLGAGIRLRGLDQEFRWAVVELRQRFWNTNYVGVHFGGSLYSMTDPIYMLLVMERFRIEGWLQDYIIWDKAASIRFRRPGRGTVRAEFKITDDQIRDFKTKADQLEKVEPVLTVLVKNEKDEVVAEIEKTLYIKKK